MRDMPYSVESSLPVLRGRQTVSESRMQGPGVPPKTEEGGRSIDMDPKVKLACSKMRELADRMTQLTNGDQQMREAAEALRVEADDLEAKLSKGEDQ